MKSDVKVKGIAGILVLLMIVIPLTSAVPMVTTPSISIPGSAQVQIASDTVKTSSSSQSGNSDAAVIEVTDAQVRAAGVDNTPGNVVSASTIDSAVVWKYISSKALKANWKKNVVKGWYVQLKNPNNKANNQWKVEMTSPKGNLDLYLQKWDGTKYKPYKVSVNKSGKETIIWTNPNNKFYCIGVGWASGVKGTYTATIKLYYVK